MYTDDVLALRVLTRVGTNPDDTRCTGPGATHTNASGLRLHYDAASRPSHFDATIDGVTEDLLLHSDGAPCASAQSAGVTVRSLDGTTPTSALAKCKDSGPVGFAGGNPWFEIAVWGGAPAP